MEWGNAVANWLTAFATSAGAVWGFITLLRQKQRLRPGLNLVVEPTDQDGLQRLSLRAWNESRVPMRVETATILEPQGAQFGTLRMDGVALAQRFRAAGPVLRLDFDLGYAGEERTRTSFRLKGGFERTTEGADADAVQCYLQAPIPGTLKVRVAYVVQADRVTHGSAVLVRPLPPARR